MGLSYRDYVSMSYGDLQAVYEGYRIRKQKEDANFRQIGWLMICAFSESGKRPKSEKEWWPMEIDQVGKAAPRKPKAIPKKNRINKDQWMVFVNRMKINTKK